MSTSGEDRKAQDASEIDQLLEELVPFGGADGDKVRVWNLTEVSTEEAPPKVQTEGLAAEPIAPSGEKLQAAPVNQKPQAAPREQKPSAPRVKRKQSLAPVERLAPKPTAAPQDGKSRLQLMVGVLSGLVLIAGFVGYWLGFQRADGSDASSVEASSTSSAIPADSADSDSVGADSAGSESAGSDAASGTADTSTETPSTVTVDATLTTETLQAELEAIDPSLVTFAPGTDQLSATGADAVANMAAVLAAHPSIPVEVGVSTFTEKTSSSNYALSTRQAETVISSLVSEGVDPARLVPVGLGGGDEQNPGASFLVAKTDDPGLQSELGEANGISVIPVQGSTLDPEASAGLDRLAEASSRNPEASLSLLGYVYAETDEASHDESHDLLDEAATYLKGQGFNLDRLSTIGMANEPMESALGTNIKIVVGSPAELSLALREVNNELIGFESGTDKLTAQSDSVLAELVSALAVNPTSTVEILTHTYTEQTSKLNHDLSHDQGDALVAALVEQGVASDQLVVSGHGDAEKFNAPGRDHYVTFTRLR